MTAERMWGEHRFRVETLGDFTAIRKTSLQTDSFCSPPNVVTSRRFLLRPSFALSEPDNSSLLCAQREICHAILFCQRNGGPICKAQTSGASGVERHSSNAPFPSFLLSSLLSYYLCGAIRSPVELIILYSDKAAREEIT